ncbi:hypothetical protein DL96DRAFT_353980 [Flagelloscypha sp. PMI_526]|nr:hypothetical protein DL96DRAFT_353980 [Flagelloscypha sp. PMI_526]
MFACFWQGGKSRLVQIIWRDGLIFFLLIVVVSIVNVVIMFVVPPAYWFCLTLFQLAMHSVAASRILLHMREEAGVGRDVRHSENEIQGRTLVMSHGEHSTIQFRGRDMDELTTWVGGSEEREELMFLGHIPPSRK